MQPSFNTLSRVQLDLGKYIASIPPSAVCDLADISLAFRSLQAWWG